MSDAASEFAGYYEQFKNAILNYILYRVNFDRDTAEDITSETFIKAFEHFDKYDRSRPFKNWIFAIAHNQLVNYYVGKKEVLSLDDSVKVIKECTIENDTDAQMEIANVMHLVSKLPEAQKEIVILRYVNDLNNSEIAETLGKEEGAVRTALSRAIAALRNAYNLQLSKKKS